MTEEFTPEQEARLEEVRRLRYDGIKAAKKQRNQEAETLYRQALQLHEQTLGVSNPAIADSLNQLIFFCAHSGQNSEAKELIERVLALLRQKPKPEYRGILRTLDGLARYHHERAEWNAAEQCYQWSLAARAEVLGPNHPRLAGTLENYAVLLRETGRGMEADSQADRAREIRDLQSNKEKGKYNDNYTGPRE